MANKFYGAECSLKVKRLARNAASAKPHVVPYVLKDLLYGPCIKWKVFKKQEEALSFSKCAKGGLMTFAFEPQDFSSGRLFLSAHPEVFWHYDSQRTDSERCSYEVITEHAACKLYADLEFDKVHNPTSDGPEMVDIFIKIVTLSLKRVWTIHCSREHILDLDSSTDSKFSRHLIFNLPSVCFVNNHNVGLLLKNVFQEVISAVDRGCASDWLEVIPLNDLRKLTVKDSRGADKLFCDLSVYSRNRHFRLYRSTKKGKHSPLVVSQDNRFPIRGELDVFLSSLVTYVYSDCKVLEVSTANGEESKKSNFTRNSLASVEICPSPFPMVDQVIGNVVKPGWIHKSFYFASSSIIVYNVIGNRFCANIGREHKSNNVKYVVDLDKCEYYQKCHDYECRGYRSPVTPLPSEVVFQLSDDADLSADSSGMLGVFGISEQEVADVLDMIEAVSSAEFSQFSEEVSNRAGGAPEGASNLQKFPSFGLSDEAFEAIDF